MPTRSTPALDTMRTITGVGDSDRSMFPETTACAAAAPESNGRTSTSTPCFLKKPSSLATYATSPENTGGTPGTAMETRSAASAGPAASANSTNGSAWLLVVGVIPGPPDRPTVELQYARIAASGTTTPDRRCRHPDDRERGGHGESQIDGPHQRAGAAPVQDGGQDGAGETDPEHHPGVARGGQHASRDPLAIRRGRPHQRAVVRRDEDPRPQAADRERGGDVCERRRWTEPREEEQPERSSAIPTIAGMRV